MRWLALWFSWLPCAKAGHGWSMFAGVVIGLHFCSFDVAFWTTLPPNIRGDCIADMWVLPVWSVVRLFGYVLPAVYGMRYAFVSFDPAFVLVLYYRFG